MGKVDIRTKEYASRPEVFSDLFNYYVYGGNEVIRSEDLQEMDTTELAFPDEGSAEYLSGLRKEDKILPVISLVLYLGQESWDAAETLHGMLTPVSESLRKYIPDYKINLLSPVMMTDEQLQLFRSDFKELATFIKYGKDKEKMKKLAEENEAFKHMDKLTAEIANDVTNAKLKIEANEKGEVDMCVAIMEIREEGRLQGLEEGRQLGREEGIRYILQNLIIETIQNKGDMPAYLIEQIQAVEEETELKEMFDTALQAESVVAFEEMLQNRKVML